LLSHSVASWKKRPNPKLQTVVPKQLLMKLLQPIHFIRD